MPERNIDNQVASTDLRFSGEPRFVLGVFGHGSSLDADNLLERMDDVHELRLSGHDGINRLIGGRRLVNDILVLTALHAFGRLSVILQGEALLGLGSAHGSARTVRTGTEGISVALSRDDERLRSHGTRNNS